MADGQKVTFSGEGDQEPGLEPGDIIIVLDEKEHSNYKRSGTGKFNQKPHYFIIFEFSSQKKKVCIFCQLKRKCATGCLIAKCIFSSRI